MKKLKIALFHPWLKSRGGAERVVLEILNNKKHNIDVYTWVYDKERTFDEFKNYNVHVLAPKFAQKFSRNFLSRGIFLLFSIFSKIDLKKYDLFLISSSGVGEFITFRNYKPGKTFAYIHTILRAAHKDEIGWNLKYRFKNIFSRSIYLGLVYFYKIFEKLAWKRIDVAIFNSELSLKRAKDHNLLENKKFFIVYPPVNLEKYKKMETKKGDYFLYVSRFNENKRQDKLVEAWRDINHKLILAGAVENKEYFNKVVDLAAKIKNIQIKTNLSEKELSEIYANCRGVVFTAYKEDFGIVPFEALALGKHLITSSDGGYAHLIKKYPQAILVSEEQLFNPKILSEIIESLENIKTERISLKETSNKQFKKNISKIIC